MNKYIDQLKEEINDPSLYLDPRAEDLGAYTNDWTKKFNGETPLVLRPRVTTDVSRMLSICNKLRLGVVPQGGNTGVVGGSTPRSGEVVLSLSRLNNLEEFDSASATLISGAGTVLSALHDFAKNKNMEFPVDLGARGQCQVGGMLATNAGGNRVLKYGLMREQVRGLEIVMANGTVVSNLNRLRKDNSGIDLKQIFIGSEGILGVITQAVLQLIPVPGSRRTAMIALPDRKILPSLLAEVRSRFPGLSSLEVLLNQVIEHVIEYVEGPVFPLPKHFPAYVLIEEETEGHASGHDGFVERLEGLFETGMIEDAVVAESSTQSEGLWHFREATGEAIVAAGYTHKFDVTIPQSAIPDFLTEMENVCSNFLGVRPLLFGHLGDGNVHVNFVQTPDINDKDFLAAAPDLAKIVYEETRNRNGSISAEHGIGMLKREYLSYSKSSEEIAFMRSLKKIWDPKNILNPGVMIG